MRAYVEERDEVVRERSIVKIETGRKNGKKVGRRREGKRRNDFDGEEKAEWESARNGYLETARLLRGMRIEKVNGSERENSEG